jgi:diadenylate cyclase
MATLLNILHKAFGYVETISITDILDIAIIAYLIYRLMLLVKNSRTGQVLKGVLFLAVAMWISSLLNMHVLSFLLSNAMEVGVLAIVIVFQPEIRNFLEQFGSGGLTTVFNRPTHHSVGELETAIDETVAAYADLSKSKTGALTVFERNSILDESIKAGTALDAAVSSELLKNIFFINAPLHDGAVIIRNGRIVGAGCVLPLSSNTNISRELGMRHRAGIGATEHTDAVVVICSEETGSISVAVNGNLRRHLAPETLRRILCNELLPKEQKPEGDKTGSSLNLKALLEMLREPKEDEQHVE